MKMKELEADTEIKPQQINEFLKAQRKQMMSTLASQEAFAKQLMEYDEALNIIVQSQLSQLQMLHEININSQVQIKQARQKYEEAQRNFKQLENQKNRQDINSKNALRMAQEKLNQLREQQNIKRNQISLLQRQINQMDQHTLILQNKINAQETQNIKIEQNMHKKKEERKKINLFIEEAYLAKKKLNNQLQQLRGSIRVYCRIRPMLDSLEEITYQLVNDNTLKLIVPKKNFRSQNHQNSYCYNFEQIFNQKQSQKEVFDELAQLIQSAADGKRVCIFAYGQTGSGKTYTMQGYDNQQRGIIPRSIDLIFQQVARARQYSWQFKISVSIEEVYLDSVRDLLITPEQENQHLPIQVNCPQDIHNLLEIAAKNRKVAETNCNQHSSRSHLIFTIHLTATNSQKSLIRKGSLNLVDLAGSERVGESGVQGQRMKETQAINKSLTQLGVVISAMARKDGHIPFRSSKLTHLLQKYLEGDSKTLMFVNISPKQSDFNQTLCSLRFAEKVKQCKLKK